MKSVDRRRPRRKTKPLALPRHACVSAGVCSAGTPCTGARCRGAEPAIPTQVLVSEIMLQQTQVARVMGHYPRFLQRYPTLEDLAAARRRRGARELGRPRLLCSRPQPARRRPSRDRRACGRLPGRSRRAAPPARHRPLHRRRGGEHRVRRGRGGGRHQHRARALARLSRARAARIGGARAAPVESRRARPAARAAQATGTRRSWISAPRSAWRAVPGVRCAPCRRSAARGADARASGRG